MGAIVDIQIERLQKLLDERKITLDARRRRRATGWPTRATIPAYGARPLKRVIQKQVQDPLAELILSGQINDGETVPVTARADRPDDRRIAAGEEKRPAGVALN